MEELKFDTGRVSYEINGVPDALAFNPTDANFVCRLMDFLESTGEKHDAMSMEIQNQKDPRQVLALYRKAEEEIRADMNDLFGEKAVDSAFQGQSCLAMVNGLPQWLNFSLAVFELIQKGCEAQRVPWLPEEEA